MSRKIESPIQINGMTLKNRIAMAPQFNAPGGFEGEVIDTTFRWFEARAKGGVGFILAGGFFNNVMTPELREMIKTFPPLSRSLVGPGDDSWIPGFKKIVDAMHAYDVKVGVQIQSPGPVNGIWPSDGPFPSKEHPLDDIWAKFSFPGPPAKEVSIEVIEQAIDDIVAQARRVKAAGCDCVQVHCTHAGPVLHGALLSPYLNKRKDKYGGNWSGRTRMVCEQIDRLRTELGPDYPIIVRISADDYVGKLGITVEDVTRYIVPAIEEAGVDCIDLSVGTIYQNPDYIFTNMYHSKGINMPVMAAVKKAAKVPVIVVGRILDMEMAEKILQEDKADIVYMCKQLCADPETPKKYFEGRVEDTRKCIGCVQWPSFWEACGRPCTVNYDLQDEAIPLTPAEKQKKVLVIGGGVGGMEAARIAAMRGHKVTLMEKGPELGGIVSALARDPLTVDFKYLVDYQTTQLRKLKVAVTVCREAGADDVNELKPDVVILATGSSVVIPEKAKGQLNVMTITEALNKRGDIGTKVVMWGLVAADYAIGLARDGKEVTIIGRGGEETLAKHCPPLRRAYILRKLTDMNVSRVFPDMARLTNPEVLYHVDVEEITPQGIRIMDRDRGVERLLPYDTLIINTQSMANDALFDQLQGKAAEVYKIGDCSKVGDIKTAIWDANEVARKI